MRKLYAFLAVTFVGATLAACGESPVTVTPDATARFEGHMFGPGHNAAPAGGHMLGSGAVMSAGETTTTTGDSTTARGGHMFGPGH